MNDDADEMIKRWQARNAGKIAAEEIADRERRRHERTIAFTRIALMQATLAEAAYRAAVALGLPPDRCRAALVPDPENKRLRPGMEIDVGIEVDPVAVKHVFSFAFNSVAEEWAFDLAYATHDARYAPQLAEAIPRKETLGAFAQRVAAWLKG